MARGKYAISLGASSGRVKDFILAGAPIEVAMVKEGAAATANTLGIPTSPAHPNATKVFMNWLLTREGQTIFSRNEVSPSLRHDVPPEGMDPRYLPQPGEKIFMLDEEAVLFASGELQGILTEVIRQAEK